MTDFEPIVAKLKKHYGPPASLLTRDPFELLLLEKCAYLAPDDRRARAFTELKTRVGTSPEQILKASIEELGEIAGIGGIYADVRALRMKQCAELTRDEYGGDLRSVLGLEFKQARKAIAKFPMIGEPGAEKILLFSGAFPCLGLESNGLRVVVRLGFGQEHRNYSTMYRGAREALNPSVAGWDCERLIVAHQLLRVHGQQLCRRTVPECEICPVQVDCAYANAGTASFARGTRGQ